jgi:hypothetical protein
MNEMKKKKEYKYSFKKNIYILFNLQQKQQG